jgi:hypothetical protein
MRESAFWEKLFMILSIGDKRVRNYLLPRLGERRAPARPQRRAKQQRPP